MTIKQGKVTHNKDMDRQQQYQACQGYQSNQIREVRIKDDITSMLTTMVKINMPLQQPHRQKGMGR